MPPAGSTATSPARAEQPHLYGRYQLLARIGIGGMAEVYRGLVGGPEGWQRELVVKRMLPALSANAEFVRMFIREAKISAVLMHPNIVQIYEFGEAEGSYFIAMESVQGVTLRQALTRLKREQRAMPFMVAADVARQVCTGLDYAHTLRSAAGVPLQIIHQDISPTNIMLAYNGTAKILDFGIARAAAFAAEDDDAAKQGLLRGKVAYLAPEQVKLQPFDHRVDLFALGAVMHEMLTGVRLFPAKNDVGRMEQMLSEEIPPPSSVNAAVPRELDRIVMKALERDPAERYDSAVTMAGDLERTLIAARYSSRDLSKLLHGLFLPAEAPLVLVEGQLAAKATPAPAVPEVIPTTERVRSIRTEISAPTTTLRGALLAERARLIQAQWWDRAKLGMRALAVAAAITVAAFALKQFGPALLGALDPPPPAPPAETTPAR